MTNDREYALLDADFIIKANISRKDADNCLLEWFSVDSLYQFVCHEKALDEVSVHDNCGASSWLENAISTGKVKQYTDKDIVDELCDFYGVAGIEYYKKFLEDSCNSMSSSFYETYYRDVKNFDSSCGVDGFLKVLSACDQSIGRSKNLGERKAMVLSQFLMLFNPGKVYLFCSDDRGARRAFYGVTKIPCKSIMTLFFDMNKQGITKDVANEYFNPLKDFITESGKLPGNIRVYKSSGKEEESLPCQQIFDDIFEGKFESLMTGFLKYK